jgi:short-subunit dehydrogenase
MIRGPAGLPGVQRQAEWTSQSVSSILLLLTCCLSGITAAVGRLVMKDFKDQTVLITGAAAGIGRATARELASRNAVLVLVDRNKAELEQTAAELRGQGARVYTWLLDITDGAAVSQVAAEVLEEPGPPDILINNAGIGHTGELASTTMADWTRLIDVNLLGSIRMVQAFLPSMLERRHGRIANVSSGQAFFRLPTWGAYAAVKAALGVYSEVLDHELRPSGVRVTTFYPFMADTNFYDDMSGGTTGSRLALRFRRWYSMSPEAVARSLIRAISNERHVEYVHPANDLARLVNMVPPVANLVGRISALLLARRASTETQGEVT